MHAFLCPKTRRQNHVEPSMGVCPLLLPESDCGGNALPDRQLQFHRESWHWIVVRNITKSLYVPWIYAITRAKDTQATCMLLITPKHFNFCVLSVHRLRN
jgi:hypothetical protein